jgi:hypothetical protein
MPTAFMNPAAGPVAAAGEPVVEPEVLESLDEAERTRFGAAAPPRPVGCTLGPGCGCLGLPVALAAGIVVSSLMALLWVLSLGRVPFSLARMARRMQRGPFSS